jgi:RNA-directed DNA polymerase
LPAPDQPTDAPELITNQPTGIEVLGALATPYDVGDLLGIPWKTLAWVLYGHGATGYYNTWSITKRSGGLREISAPRSILWRAQHALHGILQEVYKPRPAAQGFVKSRSVATNASPHIRRKWVLGVDIEDFFPTIHFGRVRGLFLAHPFNCAPEVATVLARICCSNGSLPIGAPTSPVVSNMICVGLDRELQRLAQRTGCWYTRYADDMTFSTNRVEFPIELAFKDGDGDVQLGDDFLRILRTNKFTPNSSKTRLRSRFDRQVVTGVVVNERPNVPRTYVKRVRGMLHAWNVYGLDAAQERFVEVWKEKGKHPAARDRYPDARPNFKDVLLGRIAYLAMIRGPSDAMVRRFRDQFDNLVAERDLNHGIDYAPEPYRPPVIAVRDGPRQLLTVMFTDIVGSTEQAAILGDAAWRAIRRKHERLIKSEVGRRWGRVVKWMGDGCLAVFEHPSDAVRSAGRIALQVQPLGIQVRIGLHTGEVQWEDDDIHGLGVNISSRVGAKAGPSEILVSRTVRDLVEGSGLVFERKGVYRLKGVTGRWTLYAAAVAEA